jgi:hypothetical protein
LFSARFVPEAFSVDTISNSIPAFPRNIPTPSIGTRNTTDSTSVPSWLRLRPGFTPIKPGAFSRRFSGLHV